MRKKSIFKAYGSNFQNIEEKSEKIVNNYDIFLAKDEEKREEIGNNDDISLDNSEILPMNDEINDKTQFSLILPSKTDENAEISKKNSQIQCSPCLLKKNSNISVIIEKCEEGFSSIKSQKIAEFEEYKSSFLGMRKLTERIQKNNRKTTVENIVKLLKSSKKKGEKHDKLEKIKKFDRENENSDKFKKIDDIFDKEREISDKLEKLDKLEKDEKKQENVTNFEKSDKKQENIVKFEKGDKKLENVIKFEKGDKKIENIEKHDKLHDTLEKPTKSEKIDKSLKIDKLFDKERENHEKSFISSNENSMNPLPYTKNFKKKKSDDIPCDFPLKKIKGCENSSFLPNNSQKSKFKSKRKFVINTKEKDGLQFSQSLRETDPVSLFISSNNSKKDKENRKNDSNVAKFNDSEENIDPFRQNYRKKEERAKLTGFACDQCEKVQYLMHFHCKFN